MLLRTHGHEPGGICQFRITSVLRPPEAADWRRSTSRRGLQKAVGADEAAYVALAELQRAGFVTAYHLLARTPGIHDPVTVLTSWVRDPGRISPRAIGRMLGCRDCASYGAAAG